MTKTDTHKLCVNFRHRRPEIYDETISPVE